MTDERLQELTLEANVDGLTRDEAGELFIYIVELQTDLSRLKAMTERNYEYLNTKMDRLGGEIDNAQEKVEQSSKKVEKLLKDFTEETDGDD